MRRAYRVPFFQQFFTPSPSPPPPPSTDFFYGLLAFVYLKLRNMLRHVRDNIERVHVSYFYVSV